MLPLWYLSVLHANGFGFWLFKCVKRRLNIYCMLTFITECNQILHLCHCLVKQNVCVSGIKHSTEGYGFALLGGHCWISRMILYIQWKTVYWIHVQIRILR